MEFHAPGARLLRALQTTGTAAGSKLFDASLMLERRPISSAALSAALLRHPFMTLKVVAAIYYQALRLWLKNSRFIPIPGKRRPVRGEDMMKASLISEPRPDCADRRVLRTGQAAL